MSLMLLGVTRFASRWHTRTRAALNTSDSLFFSGRLGAVCSPLCVFYPNMKHYLRIHISTPYHDSCHDWSEELQELTLRFQGRVQSWHPEPCFCPSGVSPVRRSDPDAEGAQSPRWSEWSERSLSPRTLSGTLSRRSWTEFGRRSKSDMAPTSLTSHGKSSISLSLCCWLGRDLDDTEAA